MKHRKILACVTALVCMAASASSWSADIVVLNFDPPGVGFNDPTPVDPVGGNSGTTLGEQRLNVFAVAAQIWGSRLQSNEPIFLGALFQPQFCTPTQAVLGSAGPTSIFANFTGAPLENTWYVGALADALAFDVEDYLEFDIPGSDSVGDWGE